jgi:hypothetical protein
MESDGNLTTIICAIHVATERLQEQMSFDHVISALTYRQELRWIVTDPEMRECRIANGHRVGIGVKRMVMCQKFVWGQLGGIARC